MVSSSNDRRENEKVTKQVTKHAKTLVGVLKSKLTFTPVEDPLKEKVQKSLNQNIGPLA